MTNNKKSNSSQIESAGGALVFLNTRISPPRSKQINNMADCLVEIAHEDHSVCSYFITINFPGCNAEESWQSVNPAIDTLKKMFESLPTAYAVIGVEMHRGGHARGKKGKTLSSKGSKITREEAEALMSDLTDKAPELNYAEGESALDYDPEAPSKKAKKEEPKTLQELLGLRLEDKEEAPEKKQGSPNPSVKGNAHLHIFLSLYNSFIVPSEAKIQYCLLQDGFIDVDVKTIAYSKPKDKHKKFDAKRTLMYCIKESKDIKLGNFVRKTYGISYLSHMFYGLSNLYPLLEQFQSLAEQNKISLSLLALKKLDVLPSIPLSTNNKVLVIKLIKELMVRHKLKLFPETDELWCVSPGASFTYIATGNSLASSYSNLWTSFESRGTEGLNILQESAAWILKFLSTTDLSLFPTLKINRELIEFRDVVFDFQSNRTYQKEDFRSLFGNSVCVKFKDILFNDLVVPSKLLYSFAKTITNNVDILPFFSYYGSLFRKNTLLNKVLYVHGPPGTGKTTLVVNTLEEILGSSNIGYVESIETTFQFAGIAGKDLVVFNDFNPDKINLQLVQQLSDNLVVTVPVKHKKSKQVKPDRVIITSNNSLRIKDESPSEEKYANLPLRRRSFMIRFEHRAATKATPLESSQYFKAITDESLSFAIFCSYSNEITETYLRDPKRPKNLTPLLMGKRMPVAWRGNLITVPETNEKTFSIDNVHSYWTGVQEEANPSDY